VYSVEFLPAAARQLAKLDRSTQRRVAHTIDRLATDPRGPHTAKLQGSDDIWRVRVGDYRVFYQIADERLIVLVVAVGHRARVYRGRG
jgi:mRNA interferase RelE/StbE